MIHMNNLTLYCNCFFQHENRTSQFNQKNLICGSSSLSEELRIPLLEKHFLMDNSGDNISHLNKWLGDLTGLYWVWKNTDDEIVGTNQYRRFWNDDIIKNIEFDDNTLYVAGPYNFGDMTAMAQFIHHHGSIGLDILNEAATNKKINMDPKMIYGLAGIKGLSGCNMFFGHRKIFDKTCEILFEMMFELYEGSKYTLPYIQMPGQTRLLAFLSERILNIMYMNSEYYYGKVKLVPVPFNLIGEK
jgi:hypothetical protein